MSNMIHLNTKIKDSTVTVIVNARTCSRGRRIQAALIKAVDEIALNEMKAGNKFRESVENKSDCLALKISIDVGKQKSLAENLKDVCVNPMNLLAYLKIKLEEEKSMLEIKSQLMNEIDFLKAKCKLTDLELTIWGLENEI